MSTPARRPGGSWISQSYDKLVLVVVLAALLVSALLLVVKVGGNRRAFDRETWAQAQSAGQAAQPVDVSAYTNLLGQLAQPYQIPQQNRRMMVGEVRVASIPDGAPIAFNATTDPFTGQPQPAVNFDPDSDGDKLSDKVELALGLNPSDPSDAAADLDGDGYSNVEESQAGTNLNDPASFPPPIAKLRLARTVVNPFKFRFLGISRLADGDRYQLNLRTLERTYFARLNDVVEGFKVASYEEKADGGPTLVLDQGGKTIRLIQGRVINQDARSAVLVFLIDGTRMGVRIGDVFKLKDRSYKVVDIKDDRVLIRDEQEGRDTVVGPLSDEERGRLQGGSASSPAASPFNVPPAGRQP